MYKRGFAEMKRMEFNRPDGEKESENARLDSRGRDPDPLATQFGITSAGLWNWGKRSDAPTWIGRPCDMDTLPHCEEKVVDSVFHLRLLGEFEAAEILLATASSNDVGWAELLLLLHLWSRHKSCLRNPETGEALIMLRICCTMVVMTTKSPIRFFDITTRSNQLFLLLLLLLFLILLAHEKRRHWHIYAIEEAGIRWGDLLSSLNLDAVEKLRFLTVTDIGSDQSSLHILHSSQPHIDLPLVDFTTTTVVVVVVLLLLLLLPAHHTTPIWIL